jgi:HPt (histidine-containing phosphotransfer) domain-containing protein
VDEAREAVAATADPQAVAPATARAAGVGPDLQPGAQTLSETPAADAIDTFFGGNTALYQAFLARCKAQFPKDLAKGRDAVQRGDAQSLRHLAHSLKSVLMTLGYPQSAALARTLEDLAHRVSEAPAGQAFAAGDAQALQDGWSQLDAAVSRVL